MAKRSVKKERYSLHIQLPENVKTIIGALKERGFEAYAVGGCVRDSILRREPEDWDITTSALPEEIKAVFRRTVDTGIEHGTVTVMMDKCSYEVTTYRIDGEYRDSRHPSSVTFTDKLAEDLKRRDFTINAMAYNEDRGLVDLFGGRDDLKLGLIRCVGDANERFDEDALRILRAVRFAAQLDFDIDAATRDAISVHAPRLRAVSRERILTELTKLICSAHIERIADVFQLGIVPYIAKHFREINIAQLMELKAAALRANFREGTDFDTAFDLKRQASSEYRYIRFALLTEGMSAANVDEMLKDLKADNYTRKNAARLAEHILSPMPADAVEMKRVMSGMKPELFMALLRIKLISSNSMLYRKHCENEDICAVIDLYNHIAENEEPVYMADLAVGGDELKAEGAAEGPELGRLLKAMLNEVWREPQHNTREWLIANIDKLRS